MKKPITQNYHFFKEHIIGKQQAFNAKKEDILYINALMKKSVSGHSVGKTTLKENPELVSTD